MLNTSVSVSKLSKFWVSLTLFPLSQFIYVMCVDIYLPVFVCNFCFKSCLTFIKVKQKSLWNGEENVVVFCIRWNLFRCSRCYDPISYQLASPQGTRACCSFDIKMRIFLTSLSICQIVSISRVFAGLCQTGLTSFHNIFTFAT